MHYRAAPATCLVVAFIGSLGPSESFNSSILETASGFGFQGLTVRFQVEALSFRVCEVVFRASGFSKFRFWGFQWQVVTILKLAIIQFLSLVMAREGHTLVRY